MLFKALTIETEGGEPVGEFAWRPLIIITVAVVVFGFLLPRLGMFITLPLLVVGVEPGQRRVPLDEAAASTRSILTVVQLADLHRGARPDHSAVADVQTGRGG